MTFAATNIMGETGISGDFAPLFLPGGLLVIVCLITFFIHRMSVTQLSKAFGESTKTLLGAGFVLLFTVPMVRVMINSGVNSKELVSMPLMVADWVAVEVGSIYPLFARPSVLSARSLRAPIPFRISCSANSNMVLQKGWDFPEL